MELLNDSVDGPARVPGKPVQDITLQNAGALIDSVPFPEPASKNTSSVEVGKPREVVPVMSFQFASTDQSELFPAPGLQYLSAI